MVKNVAWTAMDVLLNRQHFSPSSSTDESLLKPKHFNIDLPCITFGLLCFSIFVILSDLFRLFTSITCNVKMKIDKKFLVLSYGISAILGYLKPNLFMHIYQIHDFLTHFEDSIFKWVWVHFLFMKIFLHCSILFISLVIQQLKYLKLDHQSNNTVQIWLLSEAHSKNILLKLSIVMYQKYCFRSS